MSNMKALAIQLQEMPTVYLVGETLKRIQAHDCRFVATKELNALMNALEVECLDRFAEQVDYPTVEMD
jgi:hypothetical protein